MSNTTFQPKNNRILIKPEKKSNTTASGLELVVKGEEKPVVGIVVVGNDEYQKDSKILFSKFGFDEVTIDNEIYYVVSITNILGIF